MPKKAKVINLNEYRFEKQNFILKGPIAGPIYLDLAEKSYKRSVEIEPGFEEHAFGKRIWGEKMFKKWENMVQELNKS
jgi:hypothetical protein